MEERGTQCQKERLDVGGINVPSRGNAVLQWDLSDTPLARTDGHLRAPTEAELQVLLVALLLNEGIAYSDPATRTLVLTDHNRELIAQVIEWCLSPLARDIGHGACLRRRLSELVGIRVTRIRLDS